MTSKGKHWKCKPRISNFKGKKQSESAKKIISQKVKKQWEEGFYDNRPNLSHKKENNPSWKGGVSKRSMSSTEYKFWRSSVFKRDNWTCQTCHKRGGYLEAHHIKEWCQYPELRFEVLNGVTLCRECHNLTKRGRNKCIKKN